MNKIISFLLSPLLTASITIFSANLAYAQADPENRAEVAAHAENENDSYVSGLTSGRARSLIGGLLGVTSIVLALRVKKRSATQFVRRRSWAVIALVLGLAAFAVSIFHLADTTGGFGTGCGKAGAIVALVLGMIGAVLAGVSLRARHN